MAYRCWLVLCTCGPRERLVSVHAQQDGARDKARRFNAARGPDSDRLYYAARALVKTVDGRRKYRLLGISRRGPVGPRRSKED